MVFFNQIVEYCESDFDQHNKILFFNVGFKDFKRWSFVKFQKKLGIISNTFILEFIDSDNSLTIKQISETFDSLIII